MSDQAKRNQLKRGKDLKQGLQPLNAISETMPDYPLDARFEAALLGDLTPYFVRWTEQHRPAASPSW